MRRLAYCAAGVALLSSFLISTPAPGHAQSVYPPTPKREVADTYFGRVIPDPYRWMEPPIPRNPQFRAWLEAQNRYARQVLNRLPDRTAIQARLAELADLGTAVPQVSLAGDRWF